MPLPILLSVPHSGLRVPDDARPYCILSPEQIAKDGDEGVAKIYDLANEVAAFVDTNVARAIVDLNRAEDDRRADGVVKTHTCWNELVYDPFPPEDVVVRLLDRYYHPYHARLENEFTADIRLGIDCHTMAAVGPPIGPGPGQRRPTVCLGDAHGETLPAGWTQRLAECFHESFDTDVTVNQPFSGGYITRTHGRKRPWIQLELTRDEMMSHREKREAVLRALTSFCAQLGGG
jgi:formiminoglutamase